MYRFVKEYANAEKRLLMGCIVTDNNRAWIAERLKDIDFAVKSYTIGFITYSEAVRIIGGF